MSLYELYGCSSADELAELVLKRDPRVSDISEFYDQSKYCIENDLYTASNRKALIDLIKLNKIPETK